MGKNINEALFNEIIIVNQKSFWKKRNAHFNRNISNHAFVNCFASDYINYNVHVDLKNKF